MTLVLLLICVALQYYTNIVTVLPRYDWIKLYTSSVERFLVKTPAWGNILGVVVLLVPVLVVVGIVHLLLSRWLYGILYFIFSLLVLLYCMNAENIKQRLQGYFEALKQGDITKASQAAKPFLGRQAPNDEAGLCRAVTQEIFSRVTRQVFVYFFWFAIFGPYGALGYYTVLSLSEQKDFAQPAGFALAILDWAPVRLLGLTYALVGHFGRGLSHWLKNLLRGFDANSKLAWTSGLAGLNAKIDDASKANAKENKAAINMVTNATIVWLVVVAIFTLGNWFS